MHAVLVSMGTFGDVFPFIGLGIQLRARGHAVTLVANELYQQFAERHDFRFTELVSDEETQKLMANAGVWHPVRSALAARSLGPGEDRPAIWHHSRRGTNR